MTATPRSIACLSGFALVLTLSLAAVLLVSAPRPVFARAGATPTARTPDVASPVPTTTLSALVETLVFSPTTAYSDAVSQCDLGPRVAGTAGGRAAGDQIIARLRQFGWEVIEQPFTYRGEAVRNIIAKRGQGPAVLLGAHYDTRPKADKDPVNQNQAIVGGNDGASGVAVLLELARVLDVSRLRQQVWLAFFDAEDRGNIDGWPFAVGSEYMAAHLDEKPLAMILLDMIGDFDQKLYWEANSDPDLMAELWLVGHLLGYQDQFIPSVKWSITDDHIPFKNQGIRAVDIIDFDYPYWHTAQDTCDQVSDESLGRVGRVLEFWLTHLPLANR